MSRFSVHSWQSSFERITFFIGLFAVAAFAQNLRFQDVTNSARVSTPNDPNGYGHGVAAGDFNNDGLPDIYVVNYTALNALFLNNGNGTFTDAAVSANVAHTTTMQDRGVASADYDNDGDLDLYIATASSHANLLFRNDGNGSFSEIAGSVGLSNYAMQGQGVSWGDYNGDGDLDLFLTSYENTSALFRQNSNHTFSEVTDASGVGGIADGVQSVFFDLELDGDLDIFVSRGVNIPNSLLVNNGNGVFVDEAASRNIADPVPHGQGIAVSDYDNDGDLDLYMCDDRGPNRLYRNDNGSFDEVAAQAGVDDRSRSLGCHFADFNNDGWPDLYVINFGTNRLYRNNGDGTFDDVTSGSGADNSSRGYGSAVLDFDGDGLLDIYFSNSGQNSNLLRNTTATSNNYLKLALRGVESNRNGIGARVLLTSGGVQQMQQLLAGFAMVSGGSDLTFHFGLGNSNSASRVEVIWPSGERDVLTNVAANQALTIQEGSYPANDNTAPVISNVAASNLTNNAATIVWSTNEASDSQAEYGTSTSYGSLLDATCVSAHSITLSDLSASTTYHYRVRSKDAAGNLGVSGDFTCTTQASTPGAHTGGLFENTGDWRTVLSDPLNGSTLGVRTGGVFENTGGWRTTSPTDMIMYDLGTYVENGELEIELKNFQPSKQNSYERHHFLSMFRNPWGNHHAHENTETVWDMHAGKNYTPGVKLLSWTYDVREEERTRTYDEFDPAATYRMRLVWSDNKLQYFLDDVLQITHVLSAPLQVRYLFLGRDFTVSGDYVTEFNGNKYPALVGPRFLNLIVTETYATADNAAPQISGLASTELFANAARLSWATNEATTCHVEYGLTAAYGQRTPVLGPPTQDHETTLAALNPGQTYHYRIVAQDDAGNTRSSPDNTFTTRASGAFLFKPMADTYVERAEVHGDTRDHGNFGWINLIVSANHETYLRFQTTGLNAPIKQSKLRLRTRQAGTSAAVIRKLLGNWEEMGVTWLTKTAQFGDSLATFTDFAVDEWSEAELKSFVTGNATYNLALLGTTTGEVSLDSRESTNFQPELIVTLQETSAPEIVNVAATNLTNTSARISFTTNQNAYGSAEFDLSAHGTARLMPLGDSITEGAGSSDNAGYRSGLHALLTNFNSRFDFVGSLQNGVGLPDRDHEGHAGWYANDARDKVKNFLAQSRPEAVFVHIGTNDVSLGDHYGTVVNEIAALVDTILWFNPQTKVFLSTLIPRRDSKQSVNVNVNASLPELVNTRANAGYKIFLVDNSAAFLANVNWATEWMSDNVHPNDAGYAVMAQTWQRAYRETEYENRTSKGPLATTHLLALDNLQAGQTYHYRARAVNAASLESASADFTFTTPPAPLPSVALHGVYEFTLRARQLTPNNYVQGPSVNVTFQGISGAALGSTMTVQGFWEGADLYRVRFAPSKTGEWSWQSSSSDTRLNNKSGSFRCEGALAATHVSQRGHVRESKVYPYTFAHADSTPFFLHGDTQWSFATSAIAWPTEFQTYVDARAAQGFNYVHGLVYNVYPDSNESNEGGPIFYGGSVDSLNPGFFRALDQRVAYMNEKGLVAGLMFAWGNGGWQNFSSTAQVDRFVRYVINRYAAYNVFWILAVEYEEGAVAGGYARLGELVAAHDVYDHPITIHTIQTSATEFGNAAWQTTIYQQVPQGSQVTPDRVYGKPVINSGFGYEGNQSANEVRKKAWEIVMRGGFAVYGNVMTGDFSAEMTQQNLYSNGARFMTLLKKFWTDNGEYEISWQRFTRFEAPGNSRFLAGEPDAAYVVYVENRDAFTLDLSEARGTIAGRWFDTRTGNWSANFSAAASTAFALTPPAGGYAAYLRVVKDNAPPVITSVAAGDLTAARATITWRTDEPATSQVEYGLDKNYGAASALDTALVGSHHVRLSGLKSNETYHYRVKSQDAAGNLAVSGDSTFVTLVSTSIEEQKQATLLPAAWALWVYPNPFNIATRVQLGLPEHGRVQAVIYDLQGQEVKRLRKGVLNAGMHVLEWNGSDERNATVSNGVYLLRIIFEGGSGKREETTRRLILMK